MQKMARKGVTADDSERLGFVDHIHSSHGFSHGHQKLSVEWQRIQKGQKNLIILNFDWNRSPYECVMGSSSGEPALSQVLKFYKLSLSSPVTPFLSFLAYFS